MWTITQNLLWDAGLHCKKRLAIFPSPAGMSITRFWVAGNHGRMNYKDTKSYMSAFLSVDLLTEFAAFCLTDFIDWRYIHSWFVFSTQLVNCCPHGQRNYMVLVYWCPSTVPSLWPPPPSPTSQCTVYTDSVWLVGGVEMYCGPYLQSFTLSFWPDSKPTKLLHHPKQKWPEKTTLRDWCL